MCRSARAVAKQYPKGLSRGNPRRMPIDYLCLGYKKKAAKNAVVVRITVHEGNIQQGEAQRAVNLVYRNASSKSYFLLRSSKDCGIADVSNKVRLGDVEVEMKVGEKRSTPLR
jgi:hypothetical protein